MSAGPYFDLRLSPGESFDGTIVVANTSRRSVRLHVDSVDGLTGATSGTVYANRTDPRRETSTWITPGKDVLRLGAGERRLLRVHLHVPSGAAPGDHVGAVALQRVIPASRQGNFAVRQVLRVAVAFQVRVAGPAVAAMEVRGLIAGPLGGTHIPSVVVQLANVGRQLCRPSLRVDLARDGTSVGSVTRQLDTVLAGDTISYPVPWPRSLEAGAYQASAALTGCGTPSEKTAPVELADALTGTAAAPGPDTGVDPSRGIPWWGALLIAPLAAGGGYAFAWFRRRRRADESEPEGTPMTAAGVAARAQAVEPVSGP